MTMHILIVDDHHSVRESLQVILEDEGYRVTTAANGRQALDQVAAACPDVVLTDLNMPVMDGRELCRRLRDIAPGVPVVLMSVLGRAGREAEDDVQGFLDKPFAADELLATLGRLTPAPQQ